MRLLFFLPLLVFTASVRAAPVTLATANVAAVVAPSRLEAGEIALEGQVTAINGATGEITILATAFSTPTGRRVLPKAKAKTLVTTGETRFLDLRDGEHYGLPDLVVGQIVRAIGRDGGAGLPMRARQLEWKSAVPTIPPDPDTPLALRALLPPPQAANGVTVRVMDAGVQPENVIFDWSHQARPVFFVSYRVTPPRNAATVRPFYEWGNLIGLRAPNGEIIRSSGAGWNGKTGQGATYSFPRVNPKWKSVTALFETTSPTAGVDSNGRFLTTVAFTGEMPTAAKPKTEPGIVSKTPHGTSLTLQSIECDFARETTLIRIAIQKPTDVPDARWSIESMRGADEQGRNLRMRGAHFDSTKDSLTATFPSVPEAGAKAAHLSVTLTESAASWREKDAYRTTEVELPVAALVKANPPVKSPMPVDETAIPAVEAHDENFSARIEMSYKPDAQAIRGIVWVAAKTGTDAKAVRTLVETVAQPVTLRALGADGKFRELMLFGQEADDVFFHSDGTAPAPGETATRFNEAGGIVFGDETAFSLDVRSFKGLVHELDLKGIAVAPDAERTLDAPIGDGSLMLRKVAWLRDNALDRLAVRTAGQVRPTGKSALVLVFSRTPISPNAKLALGPVTVREPSGRSQGSYATSWDGDALSGKAGDALTLILPPPSPSATLVDIQLRATESGSDVTTATLEFPKVPWLTAGK